MTGRWISAREATALVSRSMHLLAVPEAICSRAHYGLILTRTTNLFVDDRETPGNPIPNEFWWSEGREAMTQNWASGDFSTWINQKAHWKAYGVEFEHSGIMALIGNPLPVPVKAPQIVLGGRPPQTWWDDLWCAITAQIYRGEFVPNRQADIEKAMMAWAAANGHDVAESTVRPKARKLLIALNKEDENPPAN